METVILIALCLFAWRYRRYAIRAAREWHQVYQCSRGQHPKLINVTWATPDDAETIGWDGLPVPNYWRVYRCPICWDMVRVHTFPLGNQVAERYDQAAEKWKSIPIPNALKEHHVSRTAPQSR